MTSAENRATFIIERSAKMTQKQETAVIYCRQSYTNDKDTKSIADQQKKATEYAKAHGIKVIGTAFIDENTASELYPNTEDGKRYAERDKTFQTWLTDQRRYVSFVNKKRIPYKEQLGRCFDFISLNHPTYLIVWSFERLARSEISSCLQPYITDFLKYNNTKLIETKNGSITDYNNSNDQLLSLIKAHIEYEGLKTKRRSSMNVIANRIKNSRSISNAYGVIRDRRSREIRFDSAKAEVIRYVYNSILEGKTYAEILYVMNTKFAKHRTKGAKCFYESSIYNIASNPVYCGMMRYKDGDVERIKQAVNIADPIIATDLFHKVQENVKLRKNRNGKAHYCTNGKRKSLPLSGLLYCGYCGSRLTVIYDKGKVCYRCHKYDIMEHSQCKNARIRMAFDERKDGLYDVVQKLFVISFLNEWRSQYDVAQKTAEASRLRTEIENDRNTYIAQFQRARREHNFDFLNAEFERWDKEIKEKENRLAELQEKNRIDQHKLEEEVNELYGKIANNHKLDDGLYSNLARKTIKRILVYADRITIELSDGNSFDLPRLKGKHNSKSLPTSEVRVCKLHGNGKYIIDWHKRFHLTFYGDKRKKESKLLVDNSKYSIVLK